MKKIGVIYYSAIIIFVLIAYVVGFAHQILGYGGQTTLAALLNLLGPLVIIGLSILFFVKYKNDKKRIVVSVTVINISMFICYIVLWVNSVISMWSV